MIFPPCLNSLQVCFAHLQTLISNTAQSFRAFLLLLDPKCLAKGCEKCRKKVIFKIPTWEDSTIDIRMAHTKHRNWQNEFALSSFNENFRIKLKTLSASFRTNFNI